MNLLDRLQKIEVIMTFPDEEEEVSPAVTELEKIHTLKRVFQPIIKHTLHFENIGLKNLFVAICKRANLEPFRSPDQKPTTVVVRTSNSFMTEELWPRFKRYERICNEYAEKIMQSITCQIHEITEDEVIED